MSADEQNLLALDDNPFGVRWRELSDEERSAIGAHGFERYRKLSSCAGLIAPLGARAREPGRA